MGNSKSKNSFVDAETQTESNVTIMLRPLDAKFLESIQDEGSFIGWSVETYTKEPIETVVTYAQHSAIIVHNHCFEFNEDNGIVHTSDLKVVTEKRLQKDSKEWHVTTGKPLLEFMGWVYGDENSSKFSKDNYRVGTLNCHHFIQQSCSFLEIDLPTDILNILDFCRKNSAGLNAFRPFVRSFNSQINCLQSKHSLLVTKHQVNNKNNTNKNIPSRTGKNKVSRGTLTT